MREAFQRVEQLTGARDLDEVLQVVLPPPHHHNHDTHLPPHPWPA